jgi:hypothetical protein
VKPYRGPPMTLGNAAATKVRLIVWCKKCRHQVEPDPAEMAARYGADTPVLDWRERRVCSSGSGPVGSDRRRGDLRKAAPPATNRPCAAGKIAPKAVETLGSFTPRYEISFGRVKL